MRSIMTGTKGFIGGFPDSALPDFGEPLLRQVYAETTAEVSALEEGLQAIADCPLRVVLLHYAPTATTLEGEPKGILAFLGSDRLARPVSEHIPDLVLHGHGHAGSFEGFSGKVPVYNVSIPVIGRDFWVFELERGGTREPRASSGSSSSSCSCWRCSGFSPAAAGRTHDTLKRAGRLLSGRPGSGTVDVCVPVPPCSLKPTFARSSPAWAEWRGPTA
jgi:hypothetical protein